MVMNKTQLRLLTAGLLSLCMASCGILCPAPLTLHTDELLTEDMLFEDMPAEEMPEIEIVPEEPQEDPAIQEIAEEELETEVLIE